MIETWQSVLEFWFGAPDAPDYGKPRREWFLKCADFDARVRARFEATLDAAARGELSGWCATPTGALALIIVLDQFPRNIHRGSARAFATDALALQTARDTVARGDDRLLLPVQRHFVYLPFEHAEDLATQEEALRLFETLRGDPHSAEAIDYAYRHHAIIARFGRFPHRNAVFGRPSTTEETEFLRQPGSGF